MNEIILGFLLGILAGVMGTVLLGLDLRLFLYIIRFLKSMRRMEDT